MKLPKPLILKIASNLYLKDLKYYCGISPDFYSACEDNEVMKLVFQRSMNPIFIKTKPKSLSWNQWFKIWKDLNWLAEPLVLKKILSDAAFEGFNKLIRYLLKKKKVPLSSRLFQQAVAGGHLSTVKLLTQMGSDIRHIQEEEVILSIINSQGQTKIVDYLAEKGQHFELQPFKVIREMIIAHKNGLAQEWISKYRHANLDYDILLLTSAKSNNLEMMKFLLDLGVPVNSNFGLLFYFALQNKNPELIQLAIPYGFNLRQIPEPEIQKANNLGWSHLVNLWNSQQNK